MPRPKTTGTIKWTVVGDKITQITTTKTIAVEVFSRRDILKNPKKYSEELRDVATRKYDELIENFKYDELKFS